MIKLIRWFFSSTKNQFSEKHADLYTELSKLKKRIESLERENILNLSRIEELERENVSSINAMYEIANSLEARIDMIEPPVIHFDDNDGRIVERF